MTRARIALLCLVATLPLGATGAAAFSRAEAERACAQDALHLCGRFIPDERTTGACLRANRSALSPDCRAVMTAAHGGRRRHRRHGR